MHIEILVIIWKENIISDIKRLEAMAMIIPGYSVADNLRLNNRCESVSSNPNTNHLRL